MQQPVISAIKPQPVHFSMKTSTASPVVNLLKPQMLPPCKFEYSLSPYQGESQENVYNQNEDLQKQQEIKQAGEGENEVILIRHGTSVFNLISEEFNKQTGLTFKDREAFFNFDQNLLDTQLHVKGQRQAQSLGKTLQQMNIHTVFVSPLKRTLETCYYAFKDHPEYQKIKFVVLPLVSEIYSKVCDISDSKNTFQDEKLRNFFDFSLIDQLWQLNNIQDQELKQQIESELRFDSQGVCLNLEEKMMEYVDNKFPKNVESYDSIFQRGLQTKEYIKNYIKSNNLTKDQKIVIISHNSYLRNFTAPAPDNGKGNVGGMKFANCQAVNYKF